MLSVDVLLVNLLNGVSFGFVLFILATGMSLTLGLMRVVNLAHGALFMVGGYAGLAVAQLTGNFVLGALTAAFAVGLLGLVLETAFFRRLYKQENAQVLLSIGLIYVLVNLCQWIWGAWPMMVAAPSILSGSVSVGGVTFPVYRLAIIGFGLVAAAALWLFQERTRVGAIIRAGMDNKEMTIGLGINLKVVFTAVFVLGAGVAGLCGFIGAPYLGVNLANGWDALFFAIMVVVVGGCGSIQGALLGGVIIGLADAYGRAFFPDLAYFTMYVLLIVILLVRPSGLLGRAI